MDLSLLMSDEEYLKSWRDYSAPCFYEIYKDNQVIFYFGARHSRDPQDKQWQELEQYFNKFLQITPNSNKIILVEGNKLPDKIGDRDFAISHFGERGFMYYLAKLHNIPIKLPELSIADELNELKKHFDYELVAYFFFARSAGAWLQTSKCDKFNEILNRAMETTAKRLSDAPTSIEQYSMIHKKIFNRLLTRKECDTIIRAAAPVYQDSIINNIASVDSRIRNEKIVLEAEKSWNEKKSIFMLFGSAHAVIQRRALESLVL